MKKIIKAFIILAVLVAIVCTSWLFFRSSMSIHPLVRDCYAALVRLDPGSEGYLMKIACFAIDDKDGARLLLICEKPGKDMRNRIAAGFLTRFGEYYSDLEGRRFYSPYLSRLVLIGKKINVIKPSGTETAKAVGLDRDFRLEVEYPDGRTELLSGGEVSTRQTE